MFNSFCHMQRCSVRKSGTQSFFSLWLVCIYLDKNFQTRLFCCLAHAYLYRIKPFLKLKKFKSLVVEIILLQPDPPPPFDFYLKRMCGKPLRNCALGFPTELRYPNASKCGCTVIYHRMLCLTSITKF